MPLLHNGNPVQVTIMRLDLRNRFPYGQRLTPTARWEFVGLGRIQGTVKEAASPANRPWRRLVRLHRDIDGAFVRATWSDASTGEYVFDGIRPDHTYTVSSYDYSGTYRAVIADGIVPEVVQL